MILGEKEHGVNGEIDTKTPLVPQPSENREHLVTLKAPKRVRDWVKDEINRIRKESGYEPTQGEILENLIKTGRTMPASDLGKNTGLLQTVTRDIVPESDNEKLWVRSLLDVLRSGNERFISAVTENIAIFADFCHAGRDREPEAAGTPPPAHRKTPLPLRGRAPKD